MLLGAPAVSLWTSVPLSVKGDGGEDAKFQKKVRFTRTADVHMRSGSRPLVVGKRPAKLYGETPAAQPAS